jgi:hypothetical protein
MDPVVFHRVGPLLVPRPDIEALSGEEAAEAQAEAKARVRQQVLEQKACVVLGWLLDQDTPKANFNMLRVGTGIRFAMVKELVSYCVDMGWLDQDPGPNRSVWFSVTKEGKKWLKENAK